MKFDTPLIEGVLVSRYKRFFADVRLASGEIVTAHCANSGSMLSVKDAGARVLLSPASNPERKLRFTWEIIEVAGSLVGINTGHPNRLVAEAIAAGQIPAEIVVVISDVEGAGILERARERNLSAEFIPPGKFRTKLDDDAEQAFVKRLTEAQVDLIVLAGFMRILKGEFLRAFANRVVNIHPSLLPAFPGLEAWKQALDYGVKVTGCTVHFVDQGIDSGPILGQETVPVLADDTAATLHERVQQAERRLYPQVVRALAEGRVTVKGRQTVCRAGAGE